MGGKTNIIEGHLQSAEVKNAFNLGDLSLHVLLISLDLVTVGLAFGAAFVLRFNPYFGIPQEHRDLTAVQIILENGFWTG